MLHGKRAAKVTPMRIASVVLALMPLSTARWWAAHRRPASTRVAESYVKLVLAVGRHDEMLRRRLLRTAGMEGRGRARRPRSAPRAAEAGARALMGEVEEIAAGPADRRRFLPKQVIAVEAHLRRLSGEKMTLAEECPEPLRR